MRNLLIYHSPVEEIMEQPVQPNEVVPPVTPEAVVPAPEKKKGMSGWLIALIVVVVLCCCLVVVVGVIIALSGSVLSDLSNQFKFDMNDFQYMLPFGAYLS